MWVLGTILRSSGRMANPLNQWAFSPDPVCKDFNAEEIPWYPPLLLCPERQLYEVSLQLPDSTHMLLIGLFSGVWISICDSHPYLDRTIHVAHYCYVLTPCPSRMVIHTIKGTLTSSASADHKCAMWLSMEGPTVPTADERMAHFQPLSNKLNGLIVGDNNVGFLTKEAKWEGRGRDGRGGRGRGGGDRLRKRRRERERGKEDKTGPDLIQWDSNSFPMEYTIGSIPV